MAVVTVDSLNASQTIIWVLTKEKLPDRFVCLEKAVRQAKLVSIEDIYFTTDLAFKSNPRLMFQQHTIFEYRYIHLTNINLLYRLAVRIIRK